MAAAALACAVAPGSIVVEEACLQASFPDLPARLRQIGLPVRFE
jgi:hypothetical protein